jgi:hypothetical protein
VRWDTSRKVSGFPHCAGLLLVLSFMLLV